MGALVLYACYGSGNIFWLIIAWSTQKRLDPRLAKGRGFSLYAGVGVPR
jgi:hypothetical protein